jgi:hypothetical protein
MYKWKLALAVLAIALFIAWYAFRPERLVVNRRINEAFPAAAGASSSEIIESGTFSRVMHPTTGTATIYRFAEGSRIPYAPDRDGPYFDRSTSPPKA